MDRRTFVYAEMGGGSLGLHSRSCSPIVFHLSTDSLAAGWLAYSNLVFAGPQTPVILDVNSGSPKTVIRGTGNSSWPAGRELRRAPPC